MTKLLVVTGSVRKGRAADGVLAATIKEVHAVDGFDLTIADVAAMNLPFYDNEHSPSDPNFIQTNPNVAAWSQMVTDTDAVLLLMPEYNHTLSAVQKNAIDWLYHEWTDKPMLFVAYGWYAGEHSLAQLQEISTVIKWKALESSVGLKFTQDINLDGNVLDENVSQLLAESMTKLVTAASPEPVSVA